MLGSGIQIVVKTAELDAARIIIRDKLDPANEIIVCPQCGSTDIGLGLGKHKGMKILNIVLAILHAFPLGNLKPKYYCKTCKTEIF